MNPFSFNNYDDHKINYIDVTASSWSPKRDLIALGSSKGEIFLYRLQMILIWKVNVKNEGTVNSICWHPDGNVLVVSFASGLIQYYSMYHANSLYQMRFKNSVNNMQWISINTDEYISEENLNKLYDINNIFPLFENLSQNSVYKEEIKRMEEITVLNAKFTILVGISGLSIFFLARGIFNLGSISLEDYQTSSSDRLLSVNITPYADSLSLTMQVHNENGDQVIRAHILNCSFIRENLSQLSNVSSLIVEIIHLRSLLQLHMKEIEESWEECLNDFEAGIIDYSKKRMHLKNWSLRIDFMEMVLFGCCNKDFWSCLEKSLPVCWFKQVSDRMTKMSEHIVNHCCPNMHLTVMRLLFHCDELSNILRCPSEYGDLHISSDAIAEVVDVCRGTLLKLHEFQAVLSDNMDSIKLFFQWISNGIENHTGDSENFKSFSYSELTTIMNFITNKLRVVTNENNEIISYKIEIISQYLIADDLIAPQLINDNSIHLNLIKEITDDKLCGPETLRDGLFRIRNEKSLTNMAQLMLPSVIDDICWRDEKVFVKKHYKRSDGYSITLATFPCLDEGNTLVASESYFDDNENGVIEVYAVYDPSTPILIWVQNQVEVVKSCVIHLNGLGANDSKQFIKVCKIQFYNANTLFLLISVENNGNVENCYIMVLYWNQLEEGYCEKIRVHTMDDFRSEFFSIWSSDEELCLRLSDCLHSSLLEIIPTDAVDMVVGCSRDLALVFFGKSHERCRIFVLNDE